MNISGVRGVPSLQLDFEGKNVLIYGENGTGKSSIIDAIEFFFTGTVSRFKVRPGDIVQRPFSSRGL